MPTPTGQTITVSMVSDAVAATIATPADGTVWSETIGKSESTWFPTPIKADLADSKIYVGVVALQRSRSGSNPDEPDRGRTARGLLASSHRVRIVMQGLVPADAASRDARCRELADFFQQVQDYWTKARRTLTIRGTLTNGDPFTAEAKAYPASPVVFDTRALGSDTVMAATMDFDFWLTEAW
ncbi:MAG TPA: hypothetical protein VFE62_01650 [Gemmataceae bacterium]|nr:hypothetical protein [Gemmataceae bacterium]